MIMLANLSLIEPDVSSFVFLEREYFLLRFFMALNLLFTHRFCYREMKIASQRHENMLVDGSKDFAWCFSITKSISAYTFFIIIFLSLFFYHGKINFFHHMERKNKFSSF